MISFITDEAVLYKSEFGTIFLEIWFGHAAFIRIER